MKRDDVGTKSCSADSELKREVVCHKKIVAKNVRRPFIIFR